MYAVSENCKRMHSFCYQCLIQRLEESIKKKYDMFCPVDSCPVILTETSRFLGIGKPNTCIFNLIISSTSDLIYLCVCSSQNSFITLIRAVSSA